METKTPKMTKEKLKNLVKTAKLDKANNLAIGKKITDKKDLAYIYPADCDNLEKRKAFRAHVRKKLKRLERKLNRISKGKLEGDVKKAEKELMSFKKSTLTNLVIQ